MLLNRWVKLEAKKKGAKIGLDPYDRYLAYVRMPNGKDYGEELIKKGLGECFGYKFKHPRQQAYAEAAPSGRRLKRMHKKIVG